MSTQSKVFDFYKEHLSRNDFALFQSLYQMDDVPCQFYWYQGAVIAKSEKILSLNETYLSTSYLNFFKYENEESAEKLVSSLVSESAKKDLITLVRTEDEAFFAKHGFEKVVEQYIYNFNRDELYDFDVSGIVMDPKEEVLADIYHRFTSVFTGYFIRDAQDFKQLKTVLESLGGGIVSYYDKAYVMYIRYAGHVEVLEAAYDTSGSLLKLLDFVSRGLPRIVLIASESEQIPRIIPNAHRSKKTFLMGKVNDRELFERLFHIKIISAYSAFRAFALPVFNRDYF